MPTWITSAGDWITNNWQFVAATLVAVAIAAFTILWQRQTKRLDWQPGANEAIVVTGNEYIGSRLLVSWDGKNVRRPRLITLRLKNTGKQTVEDSDYSSGIKISVPKAEIIGAFVTRTSHPDVFPEGPLKIGSPHEVELRPEFMNPKEWINLQLIVDGRSAFPDVSARFAGQSRRMRQYSETRFLLSPILYTTLFIGTLLIAFFGAGAPIGRSLAISAFVAGISFLYLGSIELLTRRMRGGSIAHFRRLMRRSLGVSS